MTRVDPHVKILSEAVVSRAKQHGIETLVYAPHFTPLPKIEREAAAYTDDDLTVLPAREIFTGSWKNRRHILAVGLTDPVPDFISLATAMEEVDRQDATVLVPHPSYLTIGLDAAACRRYRRQIDAIEVYNPKHLRRHNDRAQQLAETLAIPGFGSSYAHLSGTVGRVWTELQGPVRTATELASALAAGPIRVARASGIGYRSQQALEQLHIGWENTWEKAIRKGTPEPTPTHPEQDLYADRFREGTVD